MNCYDCAIEDHIPRRAIGLCHDCGAGICEHHTIVRAHHHTRITTIMREEPVEPPARTLRCTTCDSAYVALHQPRQQTVDDRA